MELVQSEEIESQRQMKNIETTNPEVLVDIKEYKGQSDALTSNLVVIDKAIEAQGNIAEDSAGTVSVLLTTAVNGIVSLYGRAMTIAVSTGDKELEKLLKRPFTYFFKNNKELCVQKLDAAVKLLVDKNAVLTNIDAADITGIKSKITLYKNSKDAPRAEIVAKKSEGTDALTVAIAKGKKIKNMMIKLIKNYYKDLNPKLVEKATLLGKAIFLGKRHNVGSYTVQNKLTEEPVSIASIKEVRTTSKKKHIITRVFALDGNGMCIFNKHILGKAVLTVVATGFLTETMTVTFKKNELNEFVIGLTKVLPK